MGKRSELGKPTSSVSQPTIVAVMLEALEVRAGDRVLEVGTGLGYNGRAAGDARRRPGQCDRCGDHSQLAAAARGRLALAGAGRVDVVCSDGRKGHRARAPYDRIIVTTGARRVEDAWLEQLVEGSVLVCRLALTKPGSVRSSCANAL
jgi:protein-L-isoaspartate(D-aspartate) O-methyltransferase